MQGDLNAAVNEALDMLNRTQEAGEIVLVGAGPGDPDLITLRGLRAIQSADVLMYDKLVHPSLLEYARRDVELVDVGKHGPREEAGATVGGDPGSQAARRTGSTMQQAINRRMVEQAQDGKSGSAQGW